jgi:hypothetical protein
MDSSSRWLENGLKVEFLGDDIAMDLPATCPGELVPMPHTSVGLTAHILMSTSAS